MLNNCVVPTKTYHRSPLHLPPNYHLSDFQERLVSDGDRPGGPGCQHGPDRARFFCFGLVRMVPPALVVTLCVGHPGRDLRWRLPDAHLQRNAPWRIVSFCSFFAALCCFFLLASFALMFRSIVCLQSIAWQLSYAWRKALHV